MEKESLRKMSEIEGRSFSNSIIQCYFLCVFTQVHLHCLKNVNDFTPRGIMQWDLCYWSLDFHHSVQCSALTSDMGSVVWAVTVLVFVWSKFTPFVWASHCSEADNKPLSMLWQSKPIKQVAVIDLVVSLFLQLTQDLCKPQLSVTVLWLFQLWCTECTHVYTWVHCFKRVCILCLMILDAAHLARMKARADAEFYTAVKLAEANKVP